MHVFLVTGASNAGKSSLIRALTGVGDTGPWSIGTTPHGSAFPLFVFTRSLGVEETTCPSPKKGDLPGWIQKRITNYRYLDKNRPQINNILIPLRTNILANSRWQIANFLAAFQQAGWSIQDPIIHVQKHAADNFQYAGHRVEPVPGKGVFGPNGWQVQPPAIAPDRVPANVRAAAVRTAWGWL